MPVYLARSLQNKSHAKPHFQQNSCQPVTSQLLQNSLFVLPKAIWWDVQGWVILDYFVYLRTHTSNLFKFFLQKTFPILLWGFSGTFRPQEEQRNKNKGLPKLQDTLPFIFSPLHTPVVFFQAKGNFCQRMSYTIKMLTRVLYFSRIVKTFT